mgnify:CR=1 FL=1|jgi:hypothetical protein
MKTLINPCYFGSIDQWLGIMQSSELWLEFFDNYQKQTLRNRCVILAANGKLSLSIPVHYSQKNRQLFKDVQIAYNSNWQELHLKSLASAYQMSPFYEFYIDDLQLLYQKKWKYLIDFNLSSMKMISEFLSYELSYKQSGSFTAEWKNGLDLRYLSAKNVQSPFKIKPYTQVFSNKFGFVPHLSILDLLFNQGPNSENFMIKQLTLK